MVEQVFGTEAISRATGATIRQLQWWDDTQLVEVGRRGKDRSYRQRDALKCALIVRLREKRITLAKIDGILDNIDATYGSDWLDGLFRIKSPDWILLVSFDAEEVYVHSSRLSGFEAILESAGPFVAVALRDEAQRLAEALEAA